MKNYVVRKATYADVEQMGDVLATTWKKAYACLVSSSFLNTLSGTHWQAFLEQCLAHDNMHAFVAEQDAQMVGVAVCRASEMACYPNDLELVSLYVYPDCQGIGIGQALFDQVYNIAQNEFNGVCVLDVIMENRDAIAFYEKNGFSTVGDPFSVQLDECDVSCIAMRKKY